MALVKIIVRNNGSYRVEAPPGTVEIVDGDGHAFDLAGKAVFSLCRCGASATKPFCDGAHKTNGFQSVVSAIKAEESTNPQN